MSDLPQGIDWPTLRQGFRDLITSLATTGADIEPKYAEEKQPFIDPDTGQNIVLRFTSSVEIGEDEWRYEFDNTARVLTTKQVGLRRMNLQIRCENFEEEDDNFSYVTAERVRTRLYRPSSIAALEAMDCAIVNLGNITNVSLPDADDHIRGVAVFDLQFSVSLEDYDLTEVPGGGWIETIQLSSHVKSPNGTELPNPPINVTDVLIPPGI